jgi:hypothetical protein
VTATVTRAVNGRAPKIAKRGIILHVGCGPHVQPGAVGLDTVPGSDIRHDPYRLPWPVEDSSVLTILATHVVARVNPAGGGFIRWMNECWRVLQPDRQLAIVTAAAGTMRYWAGPANCNPVTHQTFWHFDPEVKVPDGDYQTLYEIHEPAPWKIGQVFFVKERPLEVLLTKRKDLPEYHVDGKVHWR